MGLVEDAVSWAGALRERDGTGFCKVAVHIEQQDPVTNKAGNHHNAAMKQNLVTAGFISGLYAFVKGDAARFFPVNEDAALMVISRIDKCVILNDVTGASCLLE